MLLLYLCYVQLGVAEFCFESLKIRIRIIYFMSIAQVGLVALDILPWWVRLQLDVAEVFALMDWTRCPIIFFLFSTRCCLFRVTDASGCCRIFAF